MSITPNKNDLQTTEEIYKPNQLQIFVTDSQGRPIKASLELTAIQRMYNDHGDGAVRDAIYKIFKDLIDAMKK